MLPSTFMSGLKRCQYFSSLYMASGYYQLEVTEEDRDKTAFVIEYGLFSFSIMQFGLCNPFSRSVSLVAREPCWKSVIYFWLMWW